MVHVSCDFDNVSVIFSFDSLDDLVSFLIGICSLCDQIIDDCEDDFIG